MGFEQREDSGILFKQEKTGDRQPDFKGKGNVGGLAVEIAGWWKQARNGSMFLSLKFQPPYQKRAKKEEADVPF